MENIDESEAELIGAELFCREVGPAIIALVTNQGWPRDSVCTGLLNLFMKIALAGASPADAAAVIAFLRANADELEARIESANASRIVN